MTKNRVHKRRREPSVLGKVMSILHEEALRRKAVRRLERQAWSLDFITACLVKAGRVLGDGVMITVTNRDGMKLEMRYEDYKDMATEDNVFMRLDDDSFVEKFIRENARR